MVKSSKKQADANLTSNQNDDYVSNNNKNQQYGIGSSHWPGVGKVMEETSELNVVLGKLIGSGGARNHWSGDLVQMMLDEIADVYASLDFLVENNLHLNENECDVETLFYIERRRKWKRDLFHSWHKNEPEEMWPKPEDYGLPPRKSINVKTSDLPT